MIKKISILFAIWFIFELLHNLTYDSNLAYDIFIFYKHPEPGRYLTNIFYDLSAHYAWVVLTYILYIVLNLIKSVVTVHYDLYLLGLFAPYVLCVLYWRLLEFAFYFLFCNDKTNFITFPFLFILIVLTYAKARKNT